MNKKAAFGLLFFALIFLLGKILGLRLSKGYITAMYSLRFYVPESHLEAVKAALFAVGAGRIGTYDSCSWQVLGQGQFRALEGSEPYIGQQGVVETVDEFDVNMPVITLDSSEDEEDIVANWHKRQAEQRRDKQRKAEQRKNRRRRFNRRKHTPSFDLDGEITRNKHDAYYIIPADHITI